MERLFEVPSADRIANPGKGAVEQASRRFQEIRESYEEILRLRGR
ncbi:hypothetical protein ACN28I_11920 [Archangium gephyra]